MADLRKVLVALIVGIAITLVTGLVPNTPGMLVGATWYGYPLAWLIRMVVAPEFVAGTYLFTHFPWKVEMASLVADIVAWTLIVFVVLMVAMRRSKSPAQTGQRATQ